MGEVVVELRLENKVDRGMAKRGLLKEEEVRHLITKAVADSGASMLMLPQDQVEALGLDDLGSVIVGYADDRKEQRQLAGTVIVSVNNRQATVDCIVGPPMSTPLLGQVPLEIMDLLVDCPQQRLMPRPESPYLPLLMLR